MSKSKFKAISFQRVLELHSGFYGGPALTRDLLAFHLRAGRIRARCKFRKRITGESLQQGWREALAAFKKQKSEGEVEFRDIPKTLWWRSVDWKADCDSWKLRQSGLCVTTSEEPRARSFMLGVRFHSGDVRNSFDPTKRRRGNRLVGELQNKEAWREFWHEIIRLVQDGRADLGLLHHPRLSSGEKLTNHFASDRDALDDAGQLDECSIDQIVALVDRRIPIALSHESIGEEVKELRKAFNLTRAYRKSR